MPRGARSIHGSLGAYLAASVAALGGLAIVLWLGWPRSSPGQVELAADSTWTEAALDDGRRQFSLVPGQSLSVPPGTYRLTLLSAEGATESRELVVGPAGARLR